MSIIHSVTFDTIPEMVVAICEIYVQYAPEDPVPTWWEPFTKWAEDEEIDGPLTLKKKLTEIDGALSKPPWWALAEKQFKGAKKTRVVEVKTDELSDDDEEEEDDDDDEGSAVEEGGEGDEGVEGGEGTGAEDHGGDEGREGEGEPPEPAAGASDEPVGGGEGAAG